MKPEEVKDINAKICQKYGSTFGVRSMAELEFACNKVILKDIAKHIARHHPFFDGNKRTALVVAMMGKGLFGSDVDTMLWHPIFAEIMEILNEV